MDPEEKERKLYNKVQKLRQLGLLKKPEYTSTASDLLSCHSIRRFGSFSWICAYTGVLPFSWNESRQIFFKQGNPILYFFWYVILVCHSMATTHLILRFMYLKFVRHEHLSDLTLHFMWTVIYIQGAFMHLNLFVYTNQVRIFLNQFIKVIYLLDYGEMTKQTKITKFEKIMLLFLVAGCSQLVALLILHILDPNQTYYMSSLILDNNYYNPWIHVGTTSFEMISYISQWNVTLLHLFYCHSYVVLTSIWAKKIKSQLGKSPKIVYLMNYRTIQLLNTSFNECNRQINMQGHKAVIIAITVMTSYAITHFNSPFLIYFLYVNAFSLTVFFQYIAYPEASAVYKNSVKIHKIFLKRQLLYAYQRRFIKSLAPLKIDVGSVYFFRPYTPLKFFKMELTYTMKTYYYLRP